MSLSHPSSQGSGIYAEEEAERLQELKLVDSFMETAFSRNNWDDIHVTRKDCGKIHKICKIPSQKTVPAWKRGS